MSNALHELSEALATTVENVGQSVVRVEARRRLPASGIVWSADGVIVTSNHVVQRDDNIKVGLPNGQTIPATLLGRDPYTDLAALRVDPANLSVPHWAAEEQLKIGHIVLGLGRPAEKINATMGIVTAIDGSNGAITGRNENYIFTEITMYPGFSGGPLVDAAGHVHGLNTSGLMRNANLTLPVSTIRRVVTTLLQHGKMKHGYLGIAAQAVRLPTALSESLAQETGLLIMNVESNSPAENSGLLMGDTLVMLDGAPTRSMDELQSLLYGDRVTKSVPVKIIRGGSIAELTITIGERT